MFFVYVLQSIKDGKRYVGCTNNLKRRLQEHNSGLAESTRYRIPFKLIYFEAYLNRSDAFAREKILKGQWGRKFLQRVLKNYIKNS
ncbi:MAG: GIY-YIG nuclease family protein [Patescibacteria group bacterium]